MSAFVDYVTENRTAYMALIRGSASADPAMRAVTDQTRTVMVERILERAGGLGIESTASVRLAVAGWIAFVEEVTINWLADAPISRAELLTLITTSLPALAVRADG